MPDCFYTDVASGTNINIGCPRRLFLQVQVTESGVLRFNCWVGSRPRSPLLIRGFALHPVIPYLSTLPYFGRDHTGSGNMLHGVSTFNQRACLASCQSSKNLSHFPLPNLYFKASIWPVGFYFQNWKWFENSHSLLISASCHTPQTSLPQPNPTQPTNLGRSNFSWPVTTH